MSFGNTAGGLSVSKSQDGTYNTGTIKITYIAGLPKLPLLQIKLKSGILENLTPGSSTQ